MRLSILILTIMLTMGIAFGQDLIKGTAKGGPVELSGLSGDIFNGAFFASDGWTFDTTSYSLTPSQAAFLADSPNDEASYGNKTPMRCGGM